ncbi:MAG: L-seryl-tRNA(Sec) selenium transferase, partial [Comamonas sp.]|nr:L-seryl-tRNA(Sec) selenium transferase [Candidatus Comamonas equi]
MVSCSLNTAAPRLPSVDKLLQTPVLQGLQTEFGRSSVTGAVRQVLKGLREYLRDGSLQAAQVQEEALVSAVHKRLTERFAPRLKSVFNLTGTVLHTNLGRALLPQ